MNWCKLKDCDIANGIGVRVSLFVSGCTNHCKNCFQPETWDFNYGHPFDDNIQKSIINLLDASYITGLSILGGEPMEPSNQEALLPFLKNVRKIYPNKSIWCYTGFTFEELLTSGKYCHTENTEELLTMIDVLVDGRFIEELHDITLRFRGSSNQRIIDLKATFTNSNNEVVLLDLDK